MRARIIAEATSSHGGDLVLAREFIHAAAEAGADYIKFQSWRATTVRDGDPQRDWFVSAELSDEAHSALIEECQRREIAFLTTCFDVGRVEFLASLGLDAIKVGSPDLTSWAMLAKLRAAFPHVIASVGLATDGEVKAAAEALSGGAFSLLHCVSVYPVPPDASNLRRMEWLRQFTPSVGWSDHAVGLDVAKVAIAAGAQLIEKHLCLGRRGPGRVMPWDATPEELAELVRYARDVDRILGVESPPLTAEQLDNRARYIGRFGDNV
jgi:N,N'-diacetyllegionaminate synthase